MHTVVIYMPENQRAIATMVKVLDVGCGTFPYRGKDGETVVSIDFRPEIRPTVVHNLNEFPWPFTDNSFDVIYASHVMEHLKDNIEVMDEFYRLSKPLGMVIIRVPHYSGRSAWCDPTHIRAYSYYQFYYYEKGFRDHYGNSDFKIKKIKLHYIRFSEGRNILVRIINEIVNFLANLNPKFCEKVWCYWVGGLSEIYVELQAMK
jgi:SAM-dependent methyltransferase